MGSSSMDLPPFSTFRFWSADRELLPEPPEWETGYVELPVSPDTWDSVRLLRQSQEVDVYVRHLGGEARVVADWPRSGAGFYGLRLEDGEEVLDEKIWRVR